jgi:hypothetical protein
MKHIYYNSVAGGDATSGYRKNRHTANAIKI